jgi:putative Mg2+ transporter-C (MgtC) family protein
MNYEMYLLRLVLAFLFGAGIGLERQIRQRSAGLTTNALVSVGACVFILLSEIMYGHEQGNIDRLRVVSQIVTGIGFLGAGVIMRDGFNIHGLNTAATIWCSAAVGSLCGFGMFFEGGMAAVAIVGTHLALKPITDRLDRRPRKYVEMKKIGVRVVATGKTPDEDEMRSILLMLVDKLENAEIQKVERTHNIIEGDTTVSVEILTKSVGEAFKLFEKELSANSVFTKVITEMLTQRVEH